MKATDLHDLKGRIAHDALARHDPDDAPNAALTALIPCTINWILAYTLADLKDAST